MQALRELLLGGLAEGTVQWGSRLQAYAEDAHGVTLRFAGGGEARAAVLVGCDGIWSAVRGQRLAGADDALRYMGVVVLLGRAPCDHPQGGKVIGLQPLSHGVDSLHPMGLA